MQNTIERTRRIAARICQMKRRALKNRLVIHYTYENFCGMPHFEFYSYYISETGYRSDFFGSIDQFLTDDEVQEAFDIRANFLYERHQEELRKDPSFRRNCASQPGQLTLAL